MNQEKIIEGNKLIAEELFGYEVMKEFDFLYGAYPEDKCMDLVVIDKHLKYHCDWNELIKAVNKCFSIPHEGDLHMKLNDALVTLNIKEIWNVVVEFIKWYNENSDNGKKE